MKQAIVVWVSLGIGYVMGASKQVVGPQGPAGPMGPAGPTRVMGPSSILSEEPIEQPDA